MAGAQQTPLLAYDLVSRASEPQTKTILDNVIVMLWPTINPDGQQIVAEWYMKNVGTRTSCPACRACIRTTSVTTTIATRTCST